MSVDQPSNSSKFIGTFVDNLARVLNPHDKTVDGSTIFIRNMLTGGLSASVAVTLMAPIERIKLILQIQNSVSPKPGRIPYKGLRDALVRIPREQGFLSFWRGNFASVVRGFPYQALNFAFRDKYKDYLVRGLDKKKQFWRRFSGNLLSGGIAGSSAMAILYPLDYARTRMAMDFGKTKKTREIKNMRSIIRETYRKDGFVGLYRGFWFSLIGVFIYRAVYFGLFDSAKDAAPDHIRHSLPFAFFTAECAATISGLIAYPFDTVRRSMMMQSGKSRQEVTYTGSLDCMKKIYTGKGIRGFYHGGFTNALRGTGGAIMLVLYDEIQHEVWRRHPPLPPPRRTEVCITQQGESWGIPGPVEVKSRDVNAACIEGSGTCAVRKFAERINLICDH